MLSQPVKLAFAVNKLENRYARRIEQQLSAHGISYTEFMIMYFLSTAPAQTMRRVDLAARAGLTASGVTRLLAPMEKIKLVRRQPNARDARVSLIALSPAGQKILNDTMTVVEHTSAQLAEKLSESQQARLLDSIQQLLDEPLDE